MKKCVFLFMILGVLARGNAQIIICQNHYDNDYVEIEFTLPNFVLQDTILPSIYETNEKFQWIHVLNEEFGIVDSAGMPMLPKFTFNINLPSNAYDITLHLSDSNVGKINLNHRIMPYQRDFGTSDEDIEPNGIFFSYNEFFYSSPDCFPRGKIHSSSTYQIREKKGVGITVFPFKYTPELSELEVTYKAKLIISYRRNGIITNTHSSAVFEDVYQDVFKNYEPPTKINSGANYLIISPPKYRRHLEPFVNYKQSIGFTIDVETTNGNTSELIKKIIQSRYDDISLRPDYILLVGDANDIPPAEGNSSGNDVDSPVTDFPYVQLEGDDFMPDAFIGRWPVSNDTELKNIIRKTIYMEMNMQQLEKNALFIAGDDDSWWPKCAIMRQYFESAHEYAIEETFEPEGYSCEMRYQPYLNTVINKMAWNPVLLAYSGHGSFTSMGPLYNEDDNVSFITQDVLGTLFENEVFPMVFSFACKTGNYAYTENINIAESWIRATKGGVSYLGSSVSTLNTSDKVIEKKIFGEAFFDTGKRSLAKVIALGMRRYRDFFWTTSGHSERYTKSYNLLGDPSFLVRGLACPPMLSIRGDNIVRKDRMEYSADLMIEIGNGVQIGHGAELYLTAGKEIVLQDGFEVFGGELDTWIEGCKTDGTVLLVNSSDSYSDKVEVRDNNGVSVEKNQEYSIFRVYPSPAFTELTIDFVAECSGMAELKIFSMQGLCMRAYNIPVISVGKQKTTVSSISNLPSGIYRVVLSLENQTFSKTFIKQ